MRYILYYLTLINLYTFALYGLDKSRAKQKKWRVKESTLLFFSAIGGAGFAYLAMKLFHHKTRKPIFRFGVPILLFFQCIAFVTIYVFLQ